MKKLSTLSLSAVIIGFLFMSMTCSKESYFLTIEVNTPEAGSVTGEGEYASGENVELTALENAGYRFASWTAEGDYVSTELNADYKMPAKDITLKASFYIPGQGVTDIDGNTYPTVIIGQQEWMAENLRVTRFNDGTPIPYLTESSDWVQLTTPAYCWYNNDEAGNIIPYGALYSWFVIEGQSKSSEKICPEGWHVPTDAEWSSLIGYLDPRSDPNELHESQIAGGKLKAAGTTHWNNPNKGATNETGFAGIAGGFRDQGGNFVQKDDLGRWWTADEHQGFPSSAWWRSLDKETERISRHYLLKRQANSIRCIKSL
jgi:uncharacterized protein (TIGR02145 family)